MKRLRKEYLKLLVEGKYIPGSTLHNKVLYLTSGRYVMPSTGVELARGARKCADGMEVGDIKNEFELMICELKASYKPSASLSLGGYISYFLPYKVKEMLEKCCRQRCHLPVHNIPADEFSHLKLGNIECIEQGWIYMKRAMGYTYEELAAMFMIHPASLRRRVIEYKRSLGED